MHGVWKAVRYSAVGVFFAGIISTITSCTDQEQITALLLLIFMLLGGGGEETTEETSSAVFTNIGQLITTGGSNFSNLTCIDPDNPADGDGTMTSWKTNFGTLTGATNMKVKIFRINGANFDFISESSLDPIGSTGEVQFSTNLAVQKGDLIATFYDEPTSLIRNDHNGTATLECFTGDVTTSVAQGSGALSDPNRRISVQGLP